MRDFGIHASPFPSSAIVRRTEGEMRGEHNLYRKRLHSVATHSGDDSSQFRFVCVAQDRHGRAVLARKLIARLASLIRRGHRNQDVVANLL